MVQIAVKKYNNDVFIPEKLPVLLYAGQISNDPGWKFQSHKHEDLCELIYISEGEGEFIIDNKFFRACKGDIMVYNRGVIHDERSNPSNPLKTYFCGIGNLLINGMEEGFIIPSSIEPVIHTNKYMHKVENYISEIFEECSSQVLGYEVICNNLLLSLIILITRIISTQNISTAPLNTNSLGYQIKEYIDKNYTKDISLNEIASGIYVSQHYLSHVFKQETGYSPINYMINRRIGEAKRLLLTTNMNIFEISTQVGYENPNYFTMLFKKATGLSPTKFRESTAF